MPEPHVLHYDATRSSRANTFNARQLPSGTWKLELFVQFAASKIFHAVIYAHEPMRDCKRRVDPEGRACRLLWQHSEEVWRIESHRVHVDAPQSFFDLRGWCAPRDAA